MAPFGHQRGSSRGYTLVTQSSAASTRLPLERSEKIQGMLSAVCLKEALPSSSVHWATLQDTLVSIQEVKWSSWGVSQIWNSLGHVEGGGAAPRSYPGDLLEIQEAPALTSQDFVSVAAEVQN